MVNRRKENKSFTSGVSDFIWNVVGGAMVSAMLAGVIYTLVGMMASFLNGDSSYWELIYLKRYFIAVLIVYLVMPAMLAPDTYCMRMASPM